MTTLIQFVQPPTSLFETQVTLDGQQYTLSVSWLYFGQRYYATLAALDGTLIFNQALIGSPSGIPLEALSWANGFALATTRTGHGYRLGDTIALTIAGCVPTNYNGPVLALMAGPSTFSYPLASNPGAAANLGAASHDVNLAGGYFTTSTLVYREDSQQPEINP